jgi:hypothetical protein
MRASTFDAKERRRHIIVFKIGKLWLFKQFFDNKEIYQGLAGPLQPGQLSFRVQKHRREE